MTPQEFLEKALAHAQLSGHLFPEYAASEAALESAWGNSKLCREGNNLFGQKQSIHPIYETLEIPTEEFINGAWETVRTAYWVKFPTWKESFIERMKLLHRLAPEFAGYAAALQAKTGEQFVREVSKDWSTDPLRAEKVLEIHQRHFVAGRIV